MTSASIYQDIARRTDGNIYIGVVGPVRTGKSTFIKRLMETMVIPGIGDEYRRERAIDELPQSGSGKTIMTAEPKFVPEEAVNVTLEGGIGCSVRLIDSVGYLIDGALGSQEDGSERMVTTPWFPHEIPMRQAAEEGTRKVITEHSTIGIVVTTDGSVTDFPREAYVEAEKRVIGELQTLGKPFVLVLNSSRPQSQEAKALRQTLEDAYSVPCVLANCAELEEAGVLEILKGALETFPVTKLGVRLPEWVEALGEAHPLKQQLYHQILASAEDVYTVRDVRRCAGCLCAEEAISTAEVSECDLSTGCASVRLDLPREMFYQVLSTESGFSISGDGDLMGVLEGLGELKEKYSRFGEAIEQVEACGYGIVYPGKDQLTLAKPEVVRSGGRYSVKLKASAPSIHMIAVNVETEVAPVIGGERASEDVAGFLLQDFEGDISKLWSSNLFGKPLDDLAGESIHTKIRKMPPAVQEKLRLTLGRAVNENARGMICILL